MLEITVDVFSGRANPSWIVEDGEGVNYLLKQLSRNRGALAKINTGSFGLGFRGVSIKFISDGLAVRYGLPHSFEIANGATQSEG